MRNPINAMPSEQHASLEQLRQYEHIFDSIDDFVLLVDRQYCYRAVNKRYLQIFGYERMELLGQRLDVVHGPMFLDLMQPVLDRAFTGESVHMQHWMPLPHQAGWAYMDVHVTPYRNLQGEIDGAVISPRDITALKKAESTLRRYEVILSLSDDMMSLVDIQYCYKAVNDRYVTLFQRPREQILDKHVATLLGWDNFKRVKTHLLDPCFTGKSVHEQFWLTLNGRYYCLDAKAHPHYEDDGQGKPSIVGAVLSTRDITRLKHAEDSARLSEARFRDFASISADLFWEIDASHICVYLSEQHQDYIKDYKALLGQPYMEYLSTLLYDERTLGLYARLIQSHKPFSIVVQARHQDGNWRTLQCHGKPIFRDGTFQGYRCAARDVTEEHMLAKQLEYQATHDELTGLLNRREFEKQLQVALDEAKQGINHALCYLDLDQFKVVNDTAGHIAGDVLLQEIAQIIKRCIRSQDVLARFGGDEFCLILFNCSPKEAKEIAQGCVNDISQLLFCWGESAFRIGASVGVVAITEHAPKVGQLLSQADMACYAAKDRGRNRVYLEEEEYEQEARHVNLKRVADIRKGLDEGRFVLYYQSIAPLQESKTTGLLFEVLLRYQDESGKLVSPGGFIPMAERYGQMRLIDEWVVATVLREFRELFLGKRCQHIGINISGSSLNDAVFHQFVIEQVLSSGLPPERLCFEITETAVISNVTQTARFIKEMRAIGCRFALDDFGAGLSSFSYLKRFPVDYLKIDGHYVRNILSNPTDAVMVASMSDIAQSMGMKTIAEFVENQEIMAQLVELGIDYAQGYVIAKPRPLVELLLT